MSDRIPNPNDWNRDYTVGTRRSPVMFWLGLGFILFVLGGVALRYFFG